MKLATLSTLILVALLNVGCVTEGAVALEPASEEAQAEVNLALGVGYLQEERPDLAIQALRRAIEFEPRLADAHYVIAIAYDQEGSTDLSEQHHRRAAQLAPRDANIQNGSAVFLCRQNRWGEAAPYFERAIDASGNQASVTAMLNAATCARGAGDIESAEGYFRRILGVDGQNVVALRGMVDVSIRSSNFLQGRAFWQRLERTAVTEANDLLSCYVIERQLDSEPSAEACANRLQQEFPGSPAVSQLRELERDGG